MFVMVLHYMSSVQLCINPFYKKKNPSLNVRRVKKEMNGLLIVYQNHLELLTTGSN